MIQVAIRQDSNFIKSSPFSIELAFVDVQKFLDTKASYYVRQIREQGVDVATIHAPHFNILDKGLLAIWFKLRYLADKLEASHVVMHPSYGNLKNKLVLAKLGLINGLMSNHAKVCIEKFGSKRRIVSTLTDFHSTKDSFPNIYCCYDYSHVEGNEEAIEPYLGFTPVIHVSNRTDGFRHQRLFQPGKLDYKKIVKYLLRRNYDGLLVLEYMPEFHNFLVKDAEKLLAMIWEENK